MAFLHLFIINKSGGLIHNTRLSDRAPVISTNEFLRIGSTFHSLHAIASEASPVVRPPPPSAALPPPQVASGRPLRRLLKDGIVFIDGGACIFAVCRRRRGSSSCSRESPAAVFGTVLRFVPTPFATATTRDALPPRLISPASEAPRRTPLTPRAPSATSTFCTPTTRSKTRSTSSTCPSGASCSTEASRRWCRGTKGFRGPPSR